MTLMLCFELSTVASRSCSTCARALTIASLTDSLCAVAQAGSSKLRLAAFLDVHEVEEDDDVDVGSNLTVTELAKPSGR